MALSSINYNHFRKSHVFLYIFILLSALLAFASKTIFHAGMIGGGGGQFLRVDPLLAFLLIVWELETG